MPDTVALQSEETGIFLSVRDKEMLLELLDSAIEDTLTNAAIFDKHAEIRHGYHQRVNSMIALFQKIECSHRLQASLRPIPAS